MKLLLTALAVLLSLTASYSEEITLDIEINTEFEDYRYYMMYLGSAPDTLFVEQKSEYPKRITFKTDHKLPFATALHLQTIDKMAMSLNIFEVDSTYMTIKIDRINKKYQFISTEFQLNFNTVMNEMLELEEQKRNGTVTEDELNTHYSKITTQMIEEYPEHPMGYFLLTKVINKLNESDLRLVKGLINYKGADNPQIEDINQYVMTLLPKREGYSVGAGIKELTNLILPDKSETSIDISKGKHLVYIWSTWCGPCKTTLKYVNNHLDTFDSDVNLVTISVDTDSDKWYKFVGVEKYKFPTYLSKERGIMELFNVSDLPFTILIEDGKVSKLNPTVKDYIN